MSGQDWVEEFFGPMPHRPDHLDVMKISEVLLGLDATIDPRTMTQGQMEEAHAKVCASIGVDPASLHYSAIQRAMRMEGVENAGQLLAKVLEVTKGSSIWLDGFAAGARFREKILRSCLDGNHSFTDLKDHSTCQVCGASTYDIYPEG